jgi:hypothetical protein
VPQDEDVVAAEALDARGRVGVGSQGLPERSISLCAPSGDSERPVLPAEELQGLGCGYTLGRTAIQDPKLNRSAATNTARATATPGAVRHEGEQPPTQEQEVPQEGKAGLDRRPI